MKKQFHIYKFSTFKLFTKKENELYNKFQKAKKIDDKNAAKKELAELINKHKEIRTINIDVEKPTYKYQVAWFPNDLLNLFVDDKTPNRALLDDVIVIKVMHEGIFEQIIDKGFIFREKKYSFFTAGAGQQRKEVLTFVSDDALKNHNNYLMGGLSDDIINEKGGINTGKMLAYKALVMSAGTEIKIPYNKVIVVPDFETILDRKVDFIDTNDVNLPVIRGEKSIPVNHMDGAGMILPDNIDGVSGNWQFRNKWVKGALVEFDFLKFAKEVAGNTIVTDIYNNDHDIEKEDIWIIMTRSQFKMANYYNSWNDFCEKMKTIGSEFIVCGVENPPQEEKELSYQYLATLDISVDDHETIANLCKQTIDYIKRLHEDKELVLEALGATEDNNNIKPFQEALMIYPAMLQDSYTKHQIKKVMDGIRDAAKGGRILSSGYYSYIFPDVYAFCERLFLKEDNPKGLIPEGYIYNAYYTDTEIQEVDLMRSPHLHPSEHCVRKLSKSAECHNWFRGNATYVSVHDLAQLQMKNDVDGDICFVATSRDIIDHVPEGCLPLYYEMPKAKPQEINNENIKQTLKRAFEANQIGDISNALTKYLSKKYDEDFELDMIFIARLQAWNNFTIDFPKTSINIELPKKDAELYKRLVKAKSPHFFQWAKGKSETAVAECGSGVVDRICNYMENNGKYFRYKYYNNDIKFDPAMLCSGKVDRSYKKYEQLQDLLFLATNDIRYLTLKLNEVKQESSDKDREFISKFDVTYHYYRDEMIDLFDGNIDFCVNCLVDIEYFQEYRHKKSKAILWNCFGWELLKNIKDNLNSDRPLIARTRFAYRLEDNIKINEVFKKIENKMEPESINITESEYNIIDSFDDDNERILYYVLLCMAKSHGKNYFKLHKNSRDKNKKLNISTLNNLAEITNAKMILKRFEKNELIKKENGIVTVLGIDNDSELCFVVKNIWKPLVSFARHEGNAIGQCIICDDDYIKKGKTKTCGEVCSKELERRTKKDNYQKNKNSA